MKKLTVAVPLSVHKKFSALCKKQKITLTDKVNKLLKEAK